MVNVVNFLQPADCRKLHVCRLKRDFIIFSRAMGRQIACCNITSDLSETELVYHATHLKQDGWVIGSGSGYDALL